MKKYYISSEKTNAPLSGACEVNGIVYLSGQIHADEEWNIIGENTEEYFLIIMKRVEKLLSEAGLTKNDIVRVQIYITDINKLKELNKVYASYFDIHPMPVRTAVEVKALPLGASLEIDIIASR